MTDQDTNNDNQGEEERDYLFYVLPPSNLNKNTLTTTGGLCWLGPSREINHNSNEISSSLPNLSTASPSHQSIKIVSEKIIPFVKPLEEVEWHLIWNPVAGKGQAKLWLDQLVIPILTFAGVRFKLHQSSLPTTRTKIKDKSLYQEIFNLTSDQLNRSHPKVILMGGDGTTHDFLNQITTYDPLTGQPILPSLELIILPLGTANALFFSTHPSVSNLNQPRNVLRSLLLALFSTTASPTDQISKILQLAHVQVFDHDHQLTDQAIAHVVISTALHAAILHTADELRDNPEYEGSSRFSEAFKRNNTNTWKASLSLSPTRSSSNSESPPSILRYEPNQQNFISISESELNSSLEDEFSYFTSCLIDRLESNFLIAPMRSSIKNESNPSIDLIIIRPKRDLRLKEMNQEDFEIASSDQLTEVMTEAFNSGHHLQLTLPDGQPRVEYIRCGAWEWKSLSSNQEVCIDGNLIQIPQNGSVLCSVLNHLIHPLFIW
ncbi:hypothetical protein DFH28DRAFT_1131170 [Melampsora americana]|nr:hypothetical protein DFH28DRAFT_1131170 [Melampsora americana]